jgi:hypothetical protein
MLTTFFVIICFRIRSIKMKCILSLLSLVVAANASPLPIFGNDHMVSFENDIKVDSELGMKIMAHARRDKEDQYQVDISWASGFSIKFQGCHHISQWNADANEADDVRIETKRLVRFRLCPTELCTTTSAGGCKSGYGDYIIDMNTFLGYYIEAKKNIDATNCANMVCECDGAENADYCKYQCYAAVGMAETCGVNDPNNANNAKQINLNEYMNCKQNNFNRRELAEQNNKYYMGPYCAEQGGAIFLGMFTDDACTVFADEAGGSTTYESLAGSAMPYASTNIVSMDCMSCLYEAGNGNAYNTYVAAVCTYLYKTAGKCESSLSAVASASQNNVACNYMEGIKIIRKDGTIVQASSKANKTASVFIGLFVVSFLLLAAYVYYLKTKLDRASINLSE